MSSFVIEKEATFGSVVAQLYSYKESNNRLTQYIKDKLQKQIQDFDEILEKCGRSSDKSALLEEFRRLSTPRDHSIPAFDVKRSTVTEFMAEFLLENQFQCIFFEESNKKLNKSITDTDRHSTGIDVVGVQEKNEDLKFIVAEVKSSSQDTVPCSSANNLKKDVENILDFNNDRLIREINSMVTFLGKHPEQMEKYIKFLFELIAQEKSSNFFIERLIIFPFLIRDNEKIMQQKTLEDFENFSELDARGVEIIGVLWAINRDIDSFIQSVYDHDN